MQTLLLTTDLQRTVFSETGFSGSFQLSYCPYGFQSVQPTARSILGFNGQRLERPFGWYHLGNGHRVYNPVLMRFHSADRLSPFGKGGLNSYAYCGGDPINFEDPTGQYFSLIRRALGFAEKFLGRASTGVGIIFGRRAVGILGLASTVSSSGYAVVGVGMVLQAVGLPVGAMAVRAGGAAVSAGNIVTHSHTIYRTLTNSPYVRRLASRMTIRKQPKDVLHEVVVMPRIEKSASDIRKTT